MVEQRTLGRTGWRVGSLGLGTAGIAGLYGELSDETAAAVVREALDAGVNYIDTAPLYGRGLSESRIGLALREHPRAREVCVATKIGFVPDDFDYSFDATLGSVHDSLGRLGLERIPLVQVHELTAETWDAVMGPGRALAALRRLQTEGLVGHVGVTSSELATLTRAIETDEFETALIWRHYHLLDRSGDSAVRAAAARGLGLIVGTPFAGGILASGSGPGAKFFYRDAPDSVRERVARFEAVCARFDVPLAAIALQFCLRDPAVTTVIAGADRPEHVARNVATLATPIPAALWDALPADDEPQQ